MKIRGLPRRIYHKLLYRYHPLKYAKKVGVNMKGDVHLYGDISWSTEPWLIELGDNVYLTEGVRFITHDGGTVLFRKYVPDLEITKPIILGNDVYVGNNVLLLPGVVIGNNVIIGAGAVVTKDVPDNAVVGGVPARILKTSDEYFEQIQRESLHLGNLKGEIKDRALMKHYQYQGNSKGIYF